MCQDGTVQGAARGTRETSEEKRFHVGTPRGVRSEEEETEDEKRRLADLTRLNPSYVEEIQEYNKDSNFMTTRTSGEKSELVSGGKYISITKENHHDYVRS